MYCCILLLSAYALWHLCQSLLNALQPTPGYARISAIKVWLLRRRRASNKQEGYIKTTNNLIEGKSRLRENSFFVSDGNMQICRRVPRRTFITVEEQW
jgi:hypothetical protein